MRGRNGIVPREIVRVLTPGMLLETDLLAGVAQQLPASRWSRRRRLRPGLRRRQHRRAAGHQRCRLQRRRAARRRAGAHRAGRSACSPMPAWPSCCRRAPRPRCAAPELFAPLAATRAVVRCFGGAPEASGLADHPLALRALGALLAYVGEARPGATRTLQHPRLYAVGGAMVLDRATRRNLDLLESVGAAMAVRRCCACSIAPARPMGARLLRAVLGQPLLDAEPHQRAPGRGRTPGRRRRRCARDWSTRCMACPTWNAWRCAPASSCSCRANAWRSPLGLERIPRTSARPDTRGRSAGAARARAARTPRPRSSPTSAPPFATAPTVFEEGVIKPGVSAELDQHRALAGDARQWIAALEQRERERTGVRGARVGYNKVFGYYLEVSTAQCAQPTDYYQRQSSGAATVGEHLERLGWIRKQTLANAERFVTPELKEMEARVARAHDDALQLERELYNALLERLAERCRGAAPTRRAPSPARPARRAGRERLRPRLRAARSSTTATCWRSSTAATRSSSTACRRASSSPTTTRSAPRRGSCC